MVQHPDTTPPRVELERTQQRVLRSALNGVAYKLYVSLPSDYDATRKRYPVVYLLDADYSFAIAKNIVDHLAERGDLPGLILVGIAYDGPPQYALNRTRDYTPTNVPDWGMMSSKAYGPDVQRASGGAQNFRSFIQQELIPFVDSLYATSPEDRCLVGHSFGGLFGVWNLLSTPPLFRRYVIVSPSLWYDGHLALRRAADDARRIDSAGVHMYLAVGARERNNQDMVHDLDSLAVLLRSGHRSGLLFQEDVLDGETHDTVFPRALSNGLRYVFDGR